jgi:hypothetical protein
MIVSPVHKDGRVIERWLPPVEIVSYPSAFPLSPLAAHFG